MHCWPKSQSVYFRSLQSTRFVTEMCQFLLNKRNANLCLFLYANAYWSEYCSYDVCWTNFDKTSVYISIKRAHTYQTSDGKDLRNWRKNGIIQNLLHGEFSERNAFSNECFVTIIYDHNNRRYVARKKQVCIVLFQINCDVCSITVLILLSDSNSRERKLIHKSNPECKMSHVPV